MSGVEQVFREDHPAAAAWTQVTQKYEWQEYSLLVENLGGAWAQRQDTLAREFRAMQIAPCLFTPKRVALVYAAGERSEEFMHYWNQQRMPTE